MLIPEKHPISNRAPSRRAIPSSGMGPNLRAVLIVVALMVAFVAGVRVGYVRGHAAGEASDSEIRQRLSEDVHTLLVEKAEREKLATTTPVLADRTDYHFPAGHFSAAFRIFAHVLHPQSRHCCTKPATTRD
jgi:hypothetical protein